ncbi:hypothetical protein PISMIDRAFT_685897 [Pisolithus microcarpus 441]|uniref:Uncharacterized protein n=1 Tax=Pisolithus microcarpus 441 TaxID=765257 RepID=A0A0C9Z396_9AGAM|nr:hypothetical protein PISMIDRAFT_685897 [Pisolithus microcarpus 441]
MHESPDSPGYPEVTLPPFSTPGSIDSSWRFHPTIPHHHHHPALPLPRPHTSDFSRWHSDSVPGYNEDDSTTDVSSAFLLSPNVPYQFHFDLGVRQNTALKYYMDNVLRMQYLHADGSLDTALWDLINSSASARDAACLLSDLHRKACQFGRAELLAPGDMTRLQTMIPPQQPLNEGDALAGLCVVSYFLFTGGKGQWQAFLDAACRFSINVLQAYGGASRVLRSCTESLRFIIKTSIWFDVLASVTLVRTPIMLGVVSELFSPYSDATIDGIPLEPCEEYSMLSIMGCDNHIVYALAEIAALAAWKERNRSENRLSVPELVRRGQHIEKILKKPSSLPMTFHDHAQHERSHQRMLTAEVFRASAHVYLHSVISGDYPQCPEIIEAVDRTIGCLRAAESGQTGRAVVRSVVFSICIAGCLTDDLGHKEYLRKRLKEQRGIGNCSQVQHLISEVWRRRGKERVDWRQVMREAEMLLV